MVKTGFVDEVSLLLETARDAGLLLLRYFGQSIEVREKAPLDLVTEADLASENLVRARIGARFPGDSITGEEIGAGGDSPRRWYIDPLDGTVNFAHGIPHFAVCIAFYDGEGAQAAAVFNPLVRDCYTAVRGQGAFLNGLPIHASSSTLPREAHLYINAHGLRHGNHAEQLLDLYRRAGKRVQGVLNPGSMSVALTWIAAGRLDAAIALDVDRYSTPASALIMTEAGVKVTDLDGESYTPESATLLAANPALHDSMRRALTVDSDPAES